MKKAQGNKISGWFIIALSLFFVKKKTPQLGEGRLGVFMKKFFWNKNII